MRILVCGGRTFNNNLLLCNTLAKIISDAGNCSYFHDDSTDVKNTFIISGKAKGADTLAIDFAKFYHIPYKEYPADWDTHGKKAGFIRNQQMLDEGKPDLVVAFPGGNGTADMVRRARKAGIEVKEIKGAG